MGTLRDVLSICGVAFCGRKSGKRCYACVKAWYRMPENTNNRPDAFRCG